MKIKNKTYKKIYTQKLSAALKASGLGMFVMVGLNGCDGASDDCKNLNILPQAKKEECKKKESHIYASSSSSSVPMSGFFGSSSSAESESHGG